MGTGWDKGATSVDRNGQQIQEHDQVGVWVVGRVIGIKKGAREDGGDHIIVGLAVKGHLYYANSSTVEKRK